MTKFSKKMSSIQEMAQKVLRVYVDQCSGSLPHSIKMPTLPPRMLKILESHNSGHVFTLCVTVFNPVFLEIGKRSTT